MPPRAPSTAVLDTPDYLPCPWAPDAHPMMALREGDHGAYYRCSVCGSSKDASTGLVRIPERAKAPDIDVATARPACRALWERLDDDQRAVQQWSPHTDGNLRVDAFAGSGKTSTVTALVSHLVARKLVTPSQLIITTFTRKAADELYRRLAGVLPRALLDQIWLGTYHALGLLYLRKIEGGRWDTARNLDVPGNRLLQGRPLSTGLLWNFVLDHGKVPGTDVAGLNMRDNLRDASLSPGDYATEVTRLRAFGFWPGAAGLKSELPQFLTAWRRFAEAKKALKGWDFGDVLDAWRKRLKDAADESHTKRAVAKGVEPAALERLRVGALPFNPAKGRVVIVDEAQDNAVIETQIAEHVAGPRGRLVMVGDTAQSIFAFKGANPAAFAAAEEKIGARTLPLRRNYRSAPAIVSLANAIRAADPALGGVEAIPTRTALPGVVTARCRGLDPVEEAERIAGEIAQRLEGDPRLSPADFAVIVRTNARAFTVEAALLEAGIAVATTDRNAAVASATVADFAAAARLSEPEGTDQPEALALALKHVGRRLSQFIPRTALDAAVAKVRSGVPVEAAIAAAHGAGGRGGNGVRALLEAVRQIRRGAWPTRRPQLIQAALAPPKLSGLQAAKASVAQADRAELYDVLVRICRRFPSGVAFADFCDAAGGSVVRHQGKDEVDGDGTDREDGGGAAAGAATAGAATPAAAVTVTTAHAAKGLEWPICYVLAPRDAFPHARSTSKAAQAEELRLFYVACTRPMRELHLSWPTFGFERKDGSQHRVGPSRFVTEIVKPWMEKQEGGGGARVASTVGSVASRFEYEETDPTVDVAAVVKGR